jgi:hypothetical protein
MWQFTRRLTVGSLPGPPRLDKALRGTKFDKLRCWTAAQTAMPAMMMTLRMATIAFRPASAGS